MKQIELFVRKWPRTILLMILGAVIGYVLWMYIPQEYTAETKLSVSIDYNRTGKLYDMEQDILLGITEDILHSDAVMKKVFEQSGASDYASFFADTTTTRTNKTWSLSIRGKDPESIGRSALLWQQTAADHLRDAVDHAVRAEALQNELDGLTRCISDGNGSVTPAGCPVSTEETLSTIDLLQSLIREEQTESSGISSAIRIGPVSADQLEIRHASRGAAVDTFLGALAGLLVSFALVWFPKGGKPE